MLKNYLHAFLYLTILFSTVVVAARHDRDTQFSSGEIAAAHIEIHLHVPSEIGLEEQDSVPISAIITVDSEDIGKAGEIYFVAFLNGAAWMKTGPITWEPWNRKFSALQALQSFDTGLTETISINVINNLSGLPGDYMLYAGYRKVDGNLLFNSEPVKFTIEQDFSSSEQGEALQGGAATVFITNKDAFSLPSGNLSLIRRQDFSIGNSFFRNPWVTAPASTTARDGLGPVFNTNACQACHIKDGRGHPPENNQDSAISLLMRLSILPKNEQDMEMLKTHGVVPEPVYGDQLQDFAIPGLVPEGQIQIRYEAVPMVFDDGTQIELRKPVYNLAQLNFGPLAADVMMSPRIAPPMIGLGLLDTIPEATILARTDPLDLDGDGISGKANQVWDKAKQTTVLGRFGWKANAPNVRQQSAGAFNGDMGLTTSIFASDGCTTSQIDCLQAPDGGDPEVSDEILGFVVFYANNLAVPARRNVDDPQVLQGKRIFNQAKCTACHIPKLHTGASEKFPELAQQTIRPYTDLLLHDMGEGLADGRADFLATGREWKTPPLWGIGLTETVNEHTFFLHDGRARNLMEAILWHEGEGDFSRQYVLSLTKTQRDNLIKFLESL